MVHKYLDLSTAHVNSDFEKITLPFRKLSHEYGWIIFVPGDKLDDEQIEKIKDQEADYIIDLIKYAQKKKCLMINLDRDGDTIDGLVKYDW